MNKENMEEVYDTPDYSKGNLVLRERGDIRPPSAISFPSSGKNGLLRRQKGIQNKKRPPP